MEIKGKAVTYNSIGGTGQKIHAVWNGGAVCGAGKNNNRSIAGGRFNSPLNGNTHTEEDVTCEKCMNWLADMKRRQQEAN